MYVRGMEREITLNGGVTPDRKLEKVSIGKPDLA